MGEKDHCKVSFVDVSILQTASANLKKYGDSSPDAVFITKYGIMLAMERASMVEATNEWMNSDEASAWRGGSNLTEGLEAFASKRPPVWKNPAPVVPKSRL